MYSDQAELKRRRTSALSYGLTPKRRRADTMEEDNDDNTTAGGGGELETKSVPSAANEKVYETDEGAAKAQCDPVNEPGEAQHSEKNDESTGRQSEIKSVQFFDEKDEEETAANTEIKCDPVSCAKHLDKDDDSTTVGRESEITSVIPSTTDKKGFYPSTGETDEVKEVNNESSSNMTEHSMEESDAVEDTSPSSQTVSTVTREVYEREEKAAKSECDSVSGAKHSDKDDDSTRVGGESEITSVIPSATDKKGETDEGKEVNNESSSNMTERSMEESDAVKDTSPSSQTVSEGTKQLDEREESAAKSEVKCDPGNEPDDDADDDKHSKNNDHASVGECEIKPVRSATTEKGTLDTDMSVNKNKQSANSFEEINKKKQHQRETETLLGRLHLQDKHQQKLSPADFLKVRSPVKQDHETSEKELAQTFLQRLMILDYRARYIPVRQDNDKVTHSKPILKLDSVTDDNILKALFSTSVDFDQSKQTDVHPMDVQMSVYHCSDSFLKQNMITKLSQCQYALPLLVPDPVTMDIECPLWTFRQIRKTWKVNEIKYNSNIVTMKSMPICKAETPMVSFLRLGSLSLSKSQLINTLINDRHSTFFHRNCPGSTKSRHLMDGVAEIAWYCPAGKPNDTFTDCIAFCNLHCDALTNEKQCDILTEKSSINVVLVPTLGKGDKSTTVISALCKSPKPLIILIADKDGGAVELVEGKYKMGLQDRSQSDVSEELKKIIGRILSGPHASFQLETMAEVSGIRVDEDDEVCQKGKSAAMKIVNLLQGLDVSKIKDTFLPCQGQLWHKWCRINKELYHLKGHIEKEKGKKQQELMQTQQDQCIASCSKPMKLFIKTLSSSPSTEREYFLTWTQILIDALSTDDLCLILQSYDEKWSEVLALKKKHDRSDQLKRKQTELEHISTKLQSATFGLEHILREMGQIYEAHASLQKQTTRGQTDWSKYPELAAELMISGHPMELMDGDAGHVPLTWISSLLDEVIKKLGDKRVFVLSVLGVQSSGKSTMLNAMFGLQFAVSAGRCTKGAFMQLVKVSDEIKKDFHFDYILVVDTEGLRALELEGNATLHHDNELATFVVGLGNMTLINIFGENPSEMQDVLQIVVQAFMRMKKVQLTPSCVFVHQNVTDITAAEKNMHGKRQLQEKLDKMAQLAAKEEVCDAECFSDIIAFDVQKDVKYFAQLWEGSPPMAPPNPGYSESVQELKTIILSKASQSAGITLSQFKSKIQDLWNALMNEQFVFSFKNTLEIAVYRKLEVQYGNWTWALRSNMLTIENGLYTRIENGKLDKVELSYLHKEMNATYGEIKKAMTIYFDDERDKEILVQWRGRFESKIKEFHDDQVRGVKRKLDEVIEQKNACKKLDDKKTEFENKLLQKSKKLAHQLKDKAKDEEELKKQFNSVWSGWVREVTAGTKPIEDISYEGDLTIILQELGFEWSLIAESESSGRYKQIAEVGDYIHYVALSKDRDKENCSSPANRFFEFVSETTTKAEYYLKGYFQYEEQKLIRSLIDSIEKQSLDAIKGKPVATRGYSPIYLQEVANNVKENVTKFESKRKYALKKEFTVDLLLYVFDKAGRWLSESHKKFKMDNDAVTYVESKKMQYYNIFRSFCRGSSSAVVFGELICEKLSSSTVEAVCNKTAIDLAGEMKCSFPAFSGNRLNLEKHVLKSLAEKEDFGGFITYIRHPRSQAETFIREEVQKYIFTDNKIKAQKILKKNAEDISKLVSRALFTATEKVKIKRGGSDMWIKEFSSLLKDELTFDTICSQNFSDINNFDFLKEETEKGLVSVIKEVSSLSLDKMEEFRLKPDQILIDQLCNCCWVTCPFCAAVCTNTLQNHSPNDHSVPFHRSPAVNGMHVKNSVEMVVEFCTTNVASDLSFYPDQVSEELIPYKKYRTAGLYYANWRITPDESKLKYWTWFVCKFQNQLEDYYKLKFQGIGEIPSEWRTHSKEDAIKSLDEMFNL
ncbi:interferon-induced very large GTPase 1-like isoform X9 [Epinephelus fuscoguttatus]|uniref:interferon-induced very large GTPase 1-like isoform X8 n=1 Tax=Epinephelus fuscoguttatus TaxID=293821 RepID=UPI0020D0BF6D|nr:interferon-induced very large GTPase 1-like isoform X8 [Epinephelus fuscoguttatus]XP_049417974.1 interferon-induced very large GTPase 1-like isoform X9 [Epinephelus fuscoguttatus]